MPEAATNYHPNIKDDDNDDTPSRDEVCGPMPEKLKQIRCKKCCSKELGQWLACARSTISWDSGFCGLDELRHHVKRAETGYRWAMTKLSRLQQAGSEKHHSNSPTHRSKSRARISDLVDQIDFIGSRKRSTLAAPRGREGGSEGE